MILWLHLHLCTQIGTCNEFVVSRILARFINHNVPNANNRKLPATDIDGTKSKLIRSLTLTNISANMQNVANVANCCNLRFVVTEPFSREPFICVCRLMKTFTHSNSHIKSFTSDVKCFCAVYCVVLLPCHKTIIFYCILVIFSLSKWTTFEKRETFARSSYLVCMHTIMGIQKHARMEYTFSTFHKHRGASFPHSTQTQQ